MNFPCLLIFQDIRSSEHALIALKGMAAEEIAERMRATFSIIHTAATDEKPIIDTLTYHQSKAGKTIFSKASGIAEKTFEIAMEAWIGAVVK